MRIKGNSRWCNRETLCKCIFILLTLQAICISRSDAQNLKPQLLKLTNKSDSLANARPAEKLYLQFDKPYYATGDTIWFKAYLLKSTSLAPTDKSGLINIDLVNDSSKSIAQFRFPVRSGLSWGNIVLSEKDYSPGTYTLYAYTNWMRNFDQEHFFARTFSISSSAQNTILVKTAFSRTMLNGVATINAKLQLSRPDEIPYGAAPVQLKVLNGGGTVYREKTITGVDGLVGLNFPMPKKVSGLTVVVGNDKHERLAVVPIRLNRPEDADVQFMPEGGDLVAGLPAHVGFKAVGEDGRGIDISGVIVDADQHQLVSFVSTHKGMGRFDLNVEAGKAYFANVTLPGGAVRQYPLAPATNSGTLLWVKNAQNADSLFLTITASDDIIQAKESYYLIAKARGLVCFAAIVGFRNAPAITEHIAKSLFPTGIVDFTLMTVQYHALNERRVFVNQNDNLQISYATDKASYKSRDSVAVKIKVTDKMGKPVREDFSVAVTDDAQVKTDTLNDGNIMSRLLLESDMKGYIEDPGYYFCKQAMAWKDLDNLLLTQGWVGYDWNTVTSPPAFPYQAEIGLQVQGTVANMFNKPVKDTHITLFSKSPLIIMDTITDQRGRFVFDHFPRVDTPIFVIKAVNKRGKSFNVGITMDEMPSPQLAAINWPLIKPWYVDSDPTEINYAKTNTLQQDELNYKGNTHLLKAVNISATKIIKDSQNLNGPGEADVTIDEQELEKAGKKTLLQLLEEKVKGFHDGYIRMTPIEWYFVHEKPVIMLVDGVRLLDVFPMMKFVDFKNYLDDHNAEDIKGIEVMYGARYAWTYDTRFYPRNSPGNFSYIEITTRSGHGPGIDNTPGMYLYKPLPISWPARFYKPKYNVSDTTHRGVDLRSTIDWEPNLITDAKGEATFWFYTGSGSSTYTIIIQGTDLDGRLGYQSGKIVVTHDQLAAGQAHGTGK